MYGLVLESLDCVSEGNVQNALGQLGARDVPETPPVKSRDVSCQCLPTRKQVRSNIISAEVGVICDGVTVQPHSTLPFP